MPFNETDLRAIGLTLRLAGTTMALLLVLCTPLAWWLARTRSRWRGPLSAVVALPLVLPPTVIGFYLLVALGPNGPLGQLTTALGLGTLPFTFWGLVLGSLIYSLPFAVQPLQGAFEAIGERPLEAAATLGAGPLDRFFTVALPRNLLNPLRFISGWFFLTSTTFPSFSMNSTSAPGRMFIFSLMSWGMVTCPLTVTRMVPPA